MLIIAVLRYKPHYETAPVVEAWIAALQRRFSIAARPPGDNERWGFIPVMGEASHHCRPTVMIFNKLIWIWAHLVCGGLRLLWLAAA